MLTKQLGQEPFNATPKQREARTLLLPNLPNPALSQQSDPRFQSHIISELAFRTCSQSPGKERERKFAVAIRATQGPDEPLKSPAGDQCGLQWGDKPVLTIPHVPDLLLQLGVIAQCRKEQTRCLYDKVSNSQCSLLTHTVSHLIRDNS